MLAGKPPFRSVNEFVTFQKIKSLTYSIPDGFSEHASDFIREILVTHCLQYHPHLKSNDMYYARVRSSEILRSLSFIFLFD